MNEPKTEAAELQRIDNAAKVHAIGPEDSPIVVLPDGYKVHDLEGLLPLPRRVRAKVDMKTAEALIEYLNRFKDAGCAFPVLFADQDKRAIRAVLDYHTNDGQAGWGDWTATYACPFSREWSAWTARNDKAMSQVEFAEFLEERVEDVVEPAGAALLEIALKFHAIRTAVFGSAVRLATGEFQFQYNEENQKGTVEVPEKIALGIPVFHNGKAYRVEARLKYRLGDGKLQFSYKLIRPEDIVEHAFCEVRQQVAEALPELPIFDAAI